VSEATLLEARSVSKRFGAVDAIAEVTLSVDRGKVTCLLGDNGAGKSTLIKILSGVHRPDRGEILFHGSRVVLKSPRDALELGISTVFQDLAMIPLMPVVRNFFLGREPKKGRGPMRRVDWAAATRVATSELDRVGIELNDPWQAVGTLSGGERQSLAIARATYFGAEILILDEPTSALGVREARRVLRHMTRARDDGLAIVFITHNTLHAHAIGDHHVVLNRGRVLGSFERGDVTRDELQTLMAGGSEMEELALDLEE
jgi:simple sugar transport system ATP-binding protein